MNQILMVYLIEYLESPSSTQLIGITLSHSEAIALKYMLVQEEQYNDDNLCITPKQIWVNLNTKETI